MPTYKQAYGPRVLYIYFTSLFYIYKYMYYTLLFFHKSHVIVFKLMRNHISFNDFVLKNDLQKRIPIVR
jgi:hypothetical protein